MSLGFINNYYAANSKMKNIFINFNDSINFPFKKISGSGSSVIYQNNLSYCFDNDKKKIQIKTQNSAVEIIQLFFFNIPSNSKIQTIFYRFYKKIMFKSIKNNDKTIIPSKKFFTKYRYIISIPTFSYTHDQVNIHFFYYIATLDKNSYRNRNRIRNNKKISIYQDFIVKTIVIYITKILTVFFGIKVQLCVTKIHYPYLNASIFAQFIGHNSAANNIQEFKNAILLYASRHTPIKNLFVYNSGIKIKVSGRLVTQPFVPRYTTKTVVCGSFINAPIVDYAKVTMKNNLGAFTIKV